MSDLSLTQDMHVHSTFSDGKNTIAENVAEAERIGLTEMTCVDHVRSDTAWVPEFVAAVHEAGARTSIDLRCAVEAKILDTGGRLDLPPGLERIDAIYAADHQVPSLEGPLHPRTVREEIESGELDPQAVLAWIVAATAAAVRLHDHVVIAHLFSVLPKIGLVEADVPGHLIEALADTAVEGRARIEVDERWRCPSAETLRPFRRRGVPLLLSTDSHRRETIGRFDYCAGVVRDLRAPDPTASVA
jgi:putative hydrolase